MRELNQAARRIRVFENEDTWSRAFVDATAGFCGRAALFVVNGRTLRLQAARGIVSTSSIVSLDDAPAFAAAIDSRDTIVALRTRGELSAPFAEAVGEDPHGRFHLFPICGAERTFAILYADSEVNVDALEVLAILAAAVLELQSAPGRSRLVHLTASPAMVDQ